MSIFRFRQKLILFKVVLLFYSLLICSFSAQQFYGDLSVDVYLKQFCQNVHLSQINFIYIRTHESKNVISKTANFNCLNYFFGNISALMADSTQAINFQYAKQQLLFDYSNKLTLSQIEFSQMHSILFHLYTQCRHCLPFIVLLNVQQRRLQQWIQAQIDSNLRAVFVLLVDFNKIATTVHLNPVINGCYLHRGLFVPKTQSDFALLKVPYTRCNLYGQKLIASANKALPFCDIIRGADGILDRGFSLEFELLSQLERRYNFSTNLRDGKQIWGLRQMNGSWTGTIGHVARQESEFALCGITQTLDRFTDFSLSRSVLHTDVAFISQSPTSLKRKFIATSPFSVVIWAILISLMLIVSGELYLIISLDNCKRKSPIAIFLIVVKIFLRQNLGHNLLWKGQRVFSASFKLIMGIWLLVALVLSNLYSSSIYSTLTVPGVAVPIDTVEQLLQVANADTHLILMKDQSSFLDNFFQAKPKNRIYYQIGVHIKRMNQKMFQNNTQHIPIVEERRKAIVINTRIYLAMSRYLYANIPLHIGSENIGPDSIGFLFPKRSPLVKPFDLIILRLQEMGFNQKWIQDTFRRFLPKNAALYAGYSDSNKLHNNPTSNINENSSSEETILDLGHLHSVYIVWIGGIVLSSAIFTLELAGFMLWFYVRLRNPEF